MASIQGVYLALFGRPADPLGLSFFNTATGNGANLTAIGDLAATAEYQERFSGQSSTQIITSIYQSLFNREPDLTGLAFWANALANKTLSINNIAIAIYDGAQGDDVKIRDLKTDAANSFTKAIDTVAEINGYNGTAATTSARAFIAGVTTTAPTAAQIDTAVAGATTGIGTNGETFNLTSLAITGVGDNFKGGAANDLFNGNAPGTLNTGDILDGGAGTDTLQAQSGNSTQAFTISPTLTNIEKIFYGVVGQQVGAPVTFDLIKSSGYKELWTTTTGGDNDVIYNNVAADTTVGMQNVGRGGVDVTVYGAAVDATSDVALDNVGAGATGARPTLTLNTGATTVNVNATGSANSRLKTLDVNNLAGNTDTITKLVVTGDKAFRVDETINFSASNTKAEVDASKNTGGVNLNLTQDFKDLTVTGSTGNDRFNVGSSLTVADKLDGGAGRDTLAVNTEAQVVTDLQVSNFEVLELTGNLSGTLVASRISGIGEVRLGGGSTGGVIQGLASGATVKFTSAAVSTDIQIKDAAQGGTNDTLNLVLEHGGSLRNYGSVTAAGVETVVISSVKDAATSADSQNSVSLSSAQIETITIKGDQGLYLGAVNNTVKVIDASALAVGSGSTGLNANVAAGNASQGVTMTGSVGSDYLYGGDGADVIVGGAGNDILSGGDRTVPGAVTPATADVVSYDFTGKTVVVGDTVSVSIGGQTYTAAATAASPLNIANALANAIATGPANANIASAVVQGNTLVVTGTATGAAAALTSSALTYTTDAPAAPLGTAISTSIPASDGTKASATLTLNTAAGSFAAGDVIAYTFTNAGDTASSAKTLSYTVAAGDIIAGDGAATAAAIGSKIVAELTNDGIADVTAQRVGNVVTFTSTVAGQNTPDNSSVTLTADTTNTATGVTLKQVSEGADASQQTVAVDFAGLTFSAGDVVTLKFNDGNDQTVSYIVLAGDNSARVAAALDFAWGTAESADLTVSGTVLSIKDGSDAGATATITKVTTTIDKAPVISTITVARTEGVDSITGTSSSVAAADVLTGGDGKDVFVFASGSGTPGATITNIDTITDLKLGETNAAGQEDSIDLSFAVNTLVNAGVAVAAPAAANLTAAVAAIFASGGALYGQANAAGLFTYNGDTYFVAANNTGSAFGADDVIVKVTGVTGTLDLSDII